MPMFNGLAMTSVPRSLGLKILYDFPRHFGTQHVPRVVGLPFLVLVVRREHAQHDRALLEVEDPRVGASVADRPGLVRDGDARRQEARKLVLVVALLEMIEHLLARRLADNLAAVDLFEQADRLAGGRGAEAELL